MVLVVTLNDHLVLVLDPHCILHDPLAFPVVRFTCMAGVKAIGDVVGLGFKPWSQVMTW